MHPIPYSEAFVPYESVLITARDWARRNGISDGWAIQLCAAGRIAGARIVDNYQWMVPCDAVCPTRHWKLRAADKARDDAVRAARRKAWRERKKTGTDNAL